MTKISILYSMAGGGHLSLAHSVQEALNRHARNRYEIDLFDPFPSSYSYTHKTLANYFLDVYRLGYKAFENPKALPAIQSFNNLTLTKKICRYIDTYKPDIIIANHPLAAMALPKCLSQTHHQPLVVAHFADPFTIHNSWFANKTADLYLSPTSDITYLAKSYGIPPQKISTIGWLSREHALYPPQDKDAIKKAHGLSLTKKIIFIGGTGSGNSKIVDLAKAIVQDDTLTKNYQFILNPGLNPTQVSKLARLVSKHPQIFYLLPFSHNITALISVSDIVVGKAGPNFMFECIQLEKPIIAIDHLPGQEDGNVVFIKRQNIGWYEEDPEQVVRLLKRLSQNPKDLNEKLKNLKSIKSNHQKVDQKFVAALRSLSK